MYMMYIMIIRLYSLWSVLLMKDMLWLRKNDMHLMIEPLRHIEKCPINIYSGLNNGFLEG